MEEKFVSFLYLLNTHREREREREREWLIISGFENWQEEMVESNSRPFHILLPKKLLKKKSESYSLAPFQLLRCSKFLKDG